VRPRMGRQQRDDVLTRNRRSGLGSAVRNLQSSVREMWRSVAPASWASLYADYTAPS
jgi:hypothetical protein